MVRGNRLTTLVSMRNISRFALYVVGVTAFLAVGLELLLRAVFPDPDYHFEYRFLYLSPNVYQNYRDAGIWTYRPNTTIREVGVYAMASLLPPGPRIEIEYDCLMRSNNWGLLQDDDIQPGTSATLILGDSFTAGQGGCPWFGRFQARRPDEHIVNAGLMGTGFAHWRRMIGHLRERGLLIKRILVIAINDDFRRPAAAWGAETLNCLNQGICPTKAYWHPVGLTEAQSDVIERTAARLESRFPDLTPADFAALYIRQNSHAFKFISKAMATVRGLFEDINTAPAIHPETESALTLMKSLGVPLHVMMVPQRIEAGPLGMMRETQGAIDLLNTHDVAHSWCGLSGKDFLTNDGHPNRAGYDKLAACADEILTRMK